VRGPVGGQHVATGRVNAGHDTILGVDTNLQLDRGFVLRDLSFVSQIDDVSSSIRSNWGLEFFILWKSGWGRE